VTSAQALEGAFKKHPAVFARLRGRNGVFREYQALLVPATEYCILPRVDAFQLGYPEAASDSRTSSPNNLMLASYTGYGRGTRIKIAQVEIGSMSFKDVEFLAFDTLQAVGFDVVLGLTLLRRTRLDLDFASGMLRLEKAADSL